MQRGSAVGLLPRHAWSPGAVRPTRSAHTSTCTLFTVWCAGGSGLLWVLTGYPVVATLFIAPWFCNRPPQPVHGPSFGAAFRTIGYDARIELALNALIPSIYFAIHIFTLVLVDTSLYAHPTLVFTYVPMSISELARLTHPTIAAAPATYLLLLASLHFSSLYHAIVFGHTFFHMWHAGRRDGSHSTTSPDTADTMIRFLPPTGRDKKDH